MKRRSTSKPIVCDFPSLNVKTLGNELTDQLLETFAQKNNEPDLRTPLIIIWKSKDKVSIVFSKKGIQGQQIELAKTPCHFGQSRRWFLCPSCLRRAGMLFLAGESFACRRCHNLAYPSQQRLTSQDKAISRLKTIQSKIWKTPLDLWLLQKPKGMHWTKFLKLTNGWKKAAKEMIVAEKKQFSRLLNRHSRA